MSSKKQEVRSKKSVADLRTKSVDELQKMLAEARKDLLEAQKSLKANELANPRVVGKMKKEIARILTVMSELSPARHPRTRSEDPEILDNTLDSRVKHENDKTSKVKSTKGAK